MRTLIIPRIALLVSIGLAGCQRCSRGAAVVLDASIELRTDGAFRVPGLEQLADKPIAVLEESDAWSGSPESLPTVTVYENGMVITCRRGASGVEITEGTIADPTTLAATIAGRIASLAPRIRISKASDQPEVTLFGRQGDVWRAVKVVGFRASGDIDAKTMDPPEDFVDAYRALAKLTINGPRPHLRNDFVVTLTDDSVPSHAPAPWPSDVPPPPANLVPDERFVGRPRAYDLEGDAGVSLKALARSQQGYGIQAPNGDRFSVSVRVTIPAGGYLEKLRYCTSWEAEPFHDCDKRVPGRAAP